MKAIVALRPRHARRRSGTLLDTGTYYDDPGEDFFTRLDPDRAKNRALDQLRRMGYVVTLEPLGAAG